MKRMKPSLVAIHQDVLIDPKARARAERMMRCMDPDEVREVDDAALSDLALERWREFPMCGHVPSQRDPDIVFNSWHFNDIDQNSRKERRDKHPGLRTRNLGGYNGLAWRNDGNVRHIKGATCTSAWELHSIHGCPFRCAYCSYGTTMINVAVNIEDQIEMLDEWTELNQFQTVYKWDNATDINCFEPEYDATRLFVAYFRDRPDKYLLLYTGKSDNVDFLCDLDHGGKTIIQWSLAPKTQSRKIEVGTASMKGRIEAARKCQEAGYIVRFRFSPIVPVRNWREEYTEMIRLLFEQTRPDVISLCFFGWMDVDTMKSCIDADLLDPWALRLAEERTDEVAGKKFGPFPHEVRETVDRFLVDEIRRYSPDTPVSLCLDSAGLWDVFREELGRKGDGFLCNCGPVCSPGTSFYESRRAFFASRCQPAMCAAGT